MGNSITPVHLTWPEINRLLEVLNNSPCQSKDGDADLILITGLIDWYDDDPEYIGAVEGADSAFFDYVPQPRVKDCWRSEKVLPMEKEAINPQMYGADETTDIDTTV